MGKTGRLPRSPSATPPEPTLRAFIAIALSDEVLQALAAVQEQLKTQMPAGAVRWVRPEGIHLTLKFLGDIPRSQVDAVAQAMASAVSGMAPFSFTVEGRGCFPNFRRPTVIWVAVKEKSGALARLHKAVEEACASLGYPPEERPFRPHLTLGRVPREAGPARQEAVGAAVEQTEVGLLGTVDVRAIHLMRSDLQPGGAVYSELAGVPLA